MPITKVCTKCGVAKSLDAFSKARRATGERPPRGGHGVAAKCKACASHIRAPSLKAAREHKAAIAAAGFKTCGTCKAIKPRCEFHKRAASVDGLAYKCKQCVNQATKAWRGEHPNAHRDWYLANRQHKAKYWANWRAENREAVRHYMAEWGRKNQEKTNALRAKRHAAKFRATVRWANQEQIERLYRQAAELTRATGIPHEVDHIVPLQGRIVSGLHWEGNLQVLPKHENISKLNRRWPDMPC